MQSFVATADAAKPLSEAPQAAGAPDAEDGANRRVVPRTGTLLAAKIEADGVVFDCIVLDLSPRGARIHCRAPVALPDQVNLILRDGARHDARRRWSRGSQSGLEFMGAATGLGVNDETARRAREVLERLAPADPSQWLPSLRATRYFGDDALRQAAEAAELAMLRLASALRLHAGGGQRN